MLKRSFIVLVSLVVSNVLLLSGCDLIKTGTGTTAPTGNTLNLYGTDPTTLDPALAAEANSIDYILQIFGGLVAIDANMKLTADIAQSWDISKDGKTYTFHLRPEAKFQDGRTIKAKDFKYSWERACNPGTGSSTAATYLGDIAGVKEVVAGQAKEISGVLAVNDSTLQVTITAPRSYFLFRLTYPVAFVVDEANVKSGREWWRKPNGTGPFKVKEWSVGSQLVLSRNDSYYGQVANLGSVVFHMLAGVPMNLYETGDIDVAGVSYLYIDKATDPAGTFQDQLVTTPELSFYYIGFNTAKPPFDDPNIRRAFAMTVDKDKLISLVFFNTVQKANGIVPPGIDGYTEALQTPGFDVAKAKDLIKQSKYGDVSSLPTITLTTAGEDGAAATYLQAILYQWKQNLGVDVQIRELEPERYYYALDQEIDNLYDMGWIADYPHQQDFLDVLFHSGSDINYSGYTNTGVDTLLDQAGAELDSAKSTSLYQQAEQMLIDDTACIPLWFGRDYYLVKPYVKGYQPTPMGFVMLNQVSIQH
jgi:oligopeptide transport system substrate-binding protein